MKSGYKLLIKQQYSLCVILADFILNCGQVRVCPYTYEMCIDVLGLKGKMVQTYVNIHTEEERERAEK